MNILRTIGLSAATLSFAVTTLLSGGSAAAAGAASYSLSGGSVTAGNTITVNVYENSGAEPVNAFQSNVLFDSSMLQFVSATASSTFGLCGSQPAANGNVVSLGCATQGTSVTGSQLVSSITFKALATGSASVSMADSSQIVSSTTHTDIWNHGSTAAGISIGATPAAPATVTTTSPTAAKAKATTATPTATATTATPAATATSSAATDTASKDTKKNEAVSLNTAKSDTIANASNNAGRNIGLAAILAAILAASLVIMQRRRTITVNPIKGAKA